MSVLVCWLQRSLAALCLLMLTLLPIPWLGLEIQPAQAALNTNSYDGNIYALYAGNGSLVPPRSTLEQAMAADRPVVIVYYLDDASASKRYAPVVSELQRLWGNALELMPLATDPLQNRPDGGPTDPAHYWSGVVPQVVVLDGSGTVRLNASGPVELTRINAAISAATGLPLPQGVGQETTMSFNELNSEVVSR
ncbi:MAG: hypothetical protein RLZZ336_564 [Cyanobacteriota bacterium]